MREIKFRAWDNELLIMSCISVIEWHRENPQKPIYLRGKITKSKNLSEQYQEWQTGVNDYGKIQIENTILMQYTGLKDKKRKKIYEKDILRWSAKYFDGDPEDINEFIGEVCPLRYGKFRVKVSLAKYSTLDTEWFLSGITDKHDDIVRFDFNDSRTTTYDIEVIGNIYENPNLLKEK